MFCFKCGNQIPDESEFCMKCGSKVLMSSLEETTSVPVPSPLASPTFNRHLTFGLGSALTVDNTTITYKEVLITNTISIQDIANLKMKKASIIDRGYLNFEAGGQKHSFLFHKKLNEEVEEVYQFLLSVNPDASRPPTPIARCPKCRSTSLSANKKGFGVGKAVVGGAIAGPMGLTAGNIGKDKVLVTCLNCGHRFKPGK